MPYYVSLVDRRVASTMGPCFTFAAMTPLMINANDPTIPDIEAAGVLTLEQLRDALSQAHKLDGFEDKEPAPAAPEPEPISLLDVADEDHDIEGELRTLRYAEAERKRKWKEAEAAEAALAAEEARYPDAVEKSPAFDQVVFESAVREVLESGQEKNLTPKGMPKAAVISDLCGFEVKAIKIVQYCKTLEE